MKVFKLFYIVFLVAFATPAFSLPAGTIEFDGGGMGKVVFSADKHMSKGLTCDKCHKNIFTMKKGTVKISVKDHDKGNFCFTCHNPKDGMNPCEKCHKK